MKVRGLVVDKALWRRLASTMRLDPVLPSAAADDTESFATNYLRVFIVPSGHEDAGSYCLGRIDIFSCPRCTPGRLLSTYCHELVHAWFESYRMDDYFEETVEDVAEAFANSVITDLGGRHNEAASCSSYWLPNDYNERVAGLFATNESLTKLAGWRPEMRTPFPIR